MTTDANALWRWQELVQAVNGTSAADGPEITGVSIDSRSVAKGDLFIALSGKPGEGFSGGSTNFRDGHRFVDAAAKAGAAAALVSRPMPVDVLQIVVDDTFSALWKMGRSARRRLAPTSQVVAITGSAGKTTVRSWLQELLGQYAVTHASVGSYNNHWGVPLSLARMPRDARFAVFEIGTNHPGEILPLSELVCPDIALLLNVLPAHLGNFPDMRALRQEKLSIADGLVPGGTFVAMDTIIGHEWPGDKSQLKTFGFTDEADVRGERRGSVMSVTSQGSAFELTIPHDFGEHHLQSVLASVAVLMALDLDLTPVLSQLTQLGSPVGRGNKTAVGDMTVIDDSYNANPVSTQFAIEALVASDAPRTIVLIGEMLELGDASLEMHQSLLPSLMKVDEVYTFGDGLAGIAQMLPGFLGHFDSAAQFDLQTFAAARQPGDVILVKGSNKVFWVNGFVASLIAALD